MQDDPNKFHSDSLHAPKPTVDELVEEIMATSAIPDAATAISHASADDELAIAAALQDRPDAIESPSQKDDSRALNDRVAGREDSASRDSHPRQLAYSTFLSLMVVLVLLVAVRLIVPSLVESVRYGWYRGQLRAEYEMSGERLRHVSLDSLADVSQLVSQRVGPSVVHINLLQDSNAPVATGNPLQKLLMPPQVSKHFVEGQGSGFVVDKQGYILTNHHVVDGVGKIEVTTSDGRRLDAYVVGMDPPTDLALLKVDAADLLPINWGDSEQIVVGSPVWAVGSPFGLQQTVTFGIISGKHRVDLRGTRYESNVRASTAYGDLMQSDVALNPGNSGGPLVNSMGDVIGVNAAILGETYRGISFSIPSKVAMRVAQQLVSAGEVARGWLGVLMKDLDDEQRFNSEGRVQPGVMVIGFGTGDSPARDSGIEIGDVILDFDGRPVMNQSELMRFIGEADAGSTVPVEVRRGEERIALSVTLGKRSLKADQR
jgi:serine protease Do